MPRRVAGVAIPPGLQRVARPKPAPHGTQRPGGLKRYAANVSPVILGGPGDPPPGFLNGNNSPEEWDVWWALWKITGTKPGEGVWLYQGLVTLASGQFASIKPDFIVLQQPPLVIRVQSDRYHLLVNSVRIAIDHLQRTELIARGYRVIDIYPQHWRRDKTGRAVLAIVRDALNHRQRINPFYAQTSTARP